MKERAGSRSRRGRFIVPAWASPTLTRRGTERSRDASLRVRDKVAETHERGVAALRALLAAGLSTIGLLWWRSGRDGSRRR